jgi:hypothetical protein
MKLASRAELPVVEGDLPKTLAGFVSVLRDRCGADSQTSCALHLGTTSWKPIALIARALPVDARKFEIGLPTESKMTAGEFLVRVSAPAKADHPRCSVTLTESLSWDEALSLLDRLAGAFPVTGRSVQLLLFVDGAILKDASENVRGHLSLSKSAGKSRFASEVFCSFDADSKSSPAAKKTFQELSDAFGAKWRKLFPAPWLSPQDLPPASELIVIEQCIEEAFARAAADVDRASAKLTAVPNLYSPMGAAFKRAKDIQSGVREGVSFPREARQLIEVDFPGYAPCPLKKGLVFRKQLAEHLEGLLVFETASPRSFGKCFTLAYQVDFPGTRFTRLMIQPFNLSRSLFSLFHKGWLPPEWPYSTREELERALGGCRDVLRMVLAALEARLTELLSPLPTALPADAETRGALSAREAYEQALWVAKAWAEDARFAGASSGGLHFTQHAVTQGIEMDGRLRPRGCWGVRFESARLHSNLLVDVPYWGQIRWNSMVKMFPTLWPTPERHWLDSTEAMQRGAEVIREVTAGQEWGLWDCVLGEDRAVGAVWKIHASFQRQARQPACRDTYAYLRPIDGSLVHSAVYCYD